MRIVVTLDTEADDQWSHGRPLATKNVAWWPPFQELCEKYGAAPTYLITTEIAEDAAARDVLAPLVAQGRAEAGAHLHPWTTPPFLDQPGLRHNDPAHTYPCHLDEGLLRDKLQALTQQVSDAVGVRPTSFRAGRFGLDQTGARLLAELGYVVDSSVTPYVSWGANGGRPGWGGGPDFRRHRPYPFGVGGAQALVELPVTIMPTYAIARASRLARDHWDALPLRALRRLPGVGKRPQPMWLRPRPEYAADDLIALLHEAERRYLPFAVLMFHSSELMPGGSPYRRGQAEVEELLAVLDNVFAAARKAGHGFVTLTEAGRELAAFERLPVKDLTA